METLLVSIVAGLLGVGVGVALVPKGARFREKIIERCAFRCGHSHCAYCGRCWGLVEGHSTMFVVDRGMFPLCEECWTSLTVSERLPYYRGLFDAWREQGTDMENRNWSDIEEAVLAGK